MKAPDIVKHEIAVGQKKDNNTLVNIIHSEPKKNPKITKENMNLIQEREK